MAEAQDDDPTIEDVTPPVEPSRSTSMMTREAEPSTSALAAIVNNLHRTMRVSLSTIMC
jgi:hypothetical protein